MGTIACGVHLRVKQDTKIAKQMNSCWLKVGQKACRKIDSGKEKTYNSIC